MDNEKKHARASWSGKWAFVLAGAGSAVGLGNMWRFPYLDAKYGGGTFLLVYLICVFTLGISLFSARFTPRILLWINRICGCVVIFYGLKLLGSFFTTVF